MRLIRRRHALRLRRMLWVGSHESWDARKPLSYPSPRRHEEPFNKRDLGAARRVERRFKLDHRQQLLGGRHEFDDGWFSGCAQS